MALAQRKPCYADFLKVSPKIFPKKVKLQLSIFLWPPPVMDRPLYFAAVVSIFFFIFLLFSSPIISGRTYLHRRCGLSANLKCMSEMCCTRLAENTVRKNYAKNRHLRTIAQLRRARSSQLRHVSTIGKNC